MDLHITDEFALLPDNAAELGLELPSLPTVRRVRTDHGDGHVSAIEWGDEPPRAVFLHGGAQNAHTWDSVILALGVPALAVDLPVTATPRGATTVTTARGRTPTPSPLPSGSWRPTRRWWSGCRSVA